MQIVEALEGAYAFRLPDGTEITSHGLVVMAWFRDRGLELRIRLAFDHTDRTLLTASELFGRLALENDRDITIHCQLRDEVASQVQLRVAGAERITEAIFDRRCPSLEVFDLKVWRPRRLDIWERLKSGPAARPANRTQHVLFVDDHPQAARELRALLAGNPDWRVELVQREHDAVARLQRKKFDVVVACEHLAAEGGLSLLQRLVEEHPNVTRLLASTRPTGDTLRRHPVAQGAVPHPWDASLTPALLRASSLQALRKDRWMMSRMDQLGTLPVLPRTFAALVAAIADPDANIQDIARIVETDPGLAARILQLVNSAAIGLGARCGGIGQAVAILGIRMVSDLVLFLEVYDTFSPELPGFSLATQQDRAMQVAAAARLVLGARHPLADDAYTAGLMHDIGRMVLAARMPDQYLGVLAEDDGTERLDIIERRILGVTHSEVAAYLLSQWGLPNRVVDAVLHHEQPFFCTEQEFSVVDAVHVGWALVSAELTDSSGSAIDEALLEHLGVHNQLLGWSDLVRGILAA